MVLLCSVVDPSARGFFTASADPAAHFRAQRSRACVRSGPCSASVREPTLRLVGPRPRGRPRRHHHRARRRDRERRQHVVARRRRRLRRDPPGRGPGLLEPCRAPRWLRVRRRQGHPGLRAPARFVIHTVGPDLAGRHRRRGAPPRQLLPALPRGRRRDRCRHRSRSRPSAPAPTATPSPRPPGIAVEHRAGHHQRRRARPLRLLRRRGARALRARARADTPVGAAVTPGDQPARRCWRRWSRKSTST